MKFYNIYKLSLYNKTIKYVFFVRKLIKKCKNYAQKFNTLVIILRTLNLLNQNKKKKKKNYFFIA